MIWPNYGTPGDPSLDPYYRTRRQEIEAEEAQRLIRRNAIAAAEDELQAALSDVMVGFKGDGLKLQSVVIDLENCAVTITVEEAA